MTPLISIIIPIYNQADKLSACLESILKQTYLHYEVIVVNDGSTDDIEKVRTTYQSRFPDSTFYFLTQTNQGSNPSRNTGWKKAKGDYLLFCDADLVLVPGMLEKMVGALEEKREVSFVYCSFYYGPKLFRLFPYSEDRLRYMPYIHTTSLVRASDFPGFDPVVRRLQDWDLWLTMLEHGKKGQWINEPLFYVKTGGHISSWLPKFTYKLLPFLPTVKKYNQAVRYIKQKHGLT